MITIDQIPKPVDFGYKQEKALPLWGLAKDEKPMGVPNGSRYAVIDTGEVFVYDAENAKWWPW